MTNEPSLELVLVFDLDEVHGVLFADLRQGEGVRGGRGIHGVDPIDERLAVPEDQRRAIEHVRHTKVVNRRSEGPRSCRPGMVLVDQPAQNVATADLSS